MKKVVIFLFALFMPILVDADSLLSLSCDKNKVDVGDQIICRLTSKIGEDYNLIKYDIMLSDGLGLIDVRSNYSDLWNVSMEEASASNVVSGMQEFGILLIKADKSGDMKINVSNIKYGIKNNLDSIKDLKDVSYDIKVISKDNYLKSIKIDGKEISDFDKNILNYKINTTKKEIDIECEKSNLFASIKGCEKISISEKSNKNIVPIMVTSESGALRTYILEFINEDVEDYNNSLDDVIIKNDKNDTIIFNFKKDIYYYDIQVDKNVKSINIKPVLENNDLSLVKGYNGGDYKLLPGNNVILVKVKDNDGYENIYTFNVIKPIDDLSNNSYIKELKIKNYDIRFNKKVKSYNIEIKRRDKVLDFDIVLDDNNSHYVIEGNENLKNGSVIKIIVTAPDASTTTYLIYVNIEQFNYLSILYFIGIGLGLYLIVKNKDKFKRKIEDLDVDDLLDKYNKIFGDKGITKSFAKFSDDVKKKILIDAIKNNLLANKTISYKENYRKISIKKDKKKTVKKKNSKKKK